ncbi:MAG: PTS sugar transporter subunit IIA [Verrucomicrobia bacterium]|nr:PTS sugar transporter subunit IIA [Verrucomicrobiota bacterium]
MHLADFIRPEAVFFRLQSRTKEAALDAMVSACCSAEGIACFDEVRRAVFEREADRSTGIGRGLAVPHCRSDEVDDFSIGIAVLREGIDWDALDGELVRFIFLVIGPSNKPETYLQLLSQISRIMRVPDATTRLLAAATPEQVINTIAEL